MTDTFFDEPVRITVRGRDEARFRLTFSAPGLDSVGNLERDQCGGPVRGNLINWNGWTDLQSEIRGSDGNSAEIFSLTPGFLGDRASGQLFLLIPEEVSEEMQASMSRTFMGEIVGVTPIGERRTIVFMELQLVPTVTRRNAPVHN